MIPILFAALLILGVIIPQISSATTATTGRIDVLFYFSEDEYIWGSAATNLSISAASASEKAADNANIGFVYNGELSQIKGLSPSQSDSWRWELLEWNTAKQLWEKIMVDGLFAGFVAGDALAWCPNNIPKPVPDPLTKDPWPMFKCSATRQGSSPSPPALFNLAYWTANAYGPIYSSPCVVSGKMFVTVSGTLETMTCLNSVDGTFLWSTSIAQSGPGLSSPAYYNDSIFVGCGDGKIKCLDARTGRPQWSYATGSSAAVTSSPATLRGRIIVGGEDGVLYCLEEKGSLLWKANLSGAVHLSSPAIWNDKVIIGTKSGVLHCFNLSDGARIWNVTLGGEIVATPAVSSAGYAYVTSMGASSMNFYSIYLRDSVMHWNESYSASRSSPALSAGGLYIGTGTEFVGHHPDRGTRMWGLPYPNVISAPSAARGYIYFASGSTPGAVVCAKVGGASEWTFHSNESFSSSPVIADGRLYACSEQGTVMCLGREPRANVTATVSTHSKMTYLDRNTTVYITLNNTGEKSAVLSFSLTDNANRTGKTFGPLELNAGELRQINITWKPQHTGDRNISVDVLNGEATVIPASVTVGRRLNGDCVIVAPIISLGILGIIVPMMVRWRTGGRIR